MGPVTLGFLASLLAGLLTAVGALPVLFGRSVSQRSNDVLLAFAAGMMLAASFLSLIIPGIEAARSIYGGTPVAALIAVAGVLLGAAFVALLNEWIPHEHFFQGRQGPLPSSLAKIWLFVLAITIHNLPEGLAVGVGFGGGDIARGTTLAIGIGLQKRTRRSGRRAGAALLRLHEGLCVCGCRPHRPCRAGGGPGRGLCGQPVTAHAALGADIRGRSDGLRDQSRDHPRDPSARL